MDDTMSENIVQEVPNCLICGLEGKVLYSGLRDHFYNNEGVFSSKQCPSCGLIWLSQRPTPEDMGRFYADYFTHAPVNLPPVAHGEKRLLSGLRDMLRGIIICGYFGYQNEYSSHYLRRFGGWLGKFPFWRERAANEFQALPVYKEGGRILDVGCGNGDFLFMLKKMGWEVMGLETDMLAAEAARRRGIIVDSRPIEKAGLPEGWADVVTMNHVVEHIYDPVSALKECRRALKNGGVLRIYTPNALSLGHEVFGKSWRALDPPRHLQVFSPPTMRAVLIAAGFRDIKIRTSARNAAGVYNASASIAREESLSNCGAQTHKGVTAFALKESLLCFLGAQKGEEIKATALK